MGGSLEFAYYHIKEHKREDCRGRGRQRRIEGSERDEERNAREYAKAISERIFDAQAFLQRVPSFP